MSIDEIQRIMNHLDRQDEKIDAIKQTVTRVLVTVEDVPKIVDKLNVQDTSIQIMKRDQKTCQERCATIQAEKKLKSVPWGNVKSGIIVGIIMALVNLLLFYWLK